MRRRGPRQERLLARPSASVTATMREAPAQGPHIVASIEERFEKLNVWRRGDERAPHKPLLVPLAPAAYARGEHRVRFVDCVAPLTALLREFGQSTRSYHPEFPFWRPTMGCGRSWRMHRCRRGRPTHEDVAFRWRGLIVQRVRRAAHPQAAGVECHYD
jgi:hypothetical protein